MKNDRERHWWKILALPDIHWAPIAHELKEAELQDAEEEMLAT